HRERAGNRNPLLLPAGELRWMDIGLVGEPDLRQQRATALPRRGRRLLLHIEWPFDDVLERRAMRKQVEALEHHRHLRPDGNDRAGVAVDAGALDADVAAILAFEPVDTAQNGRLAGARGADDADDLALRNQCGDSLEHLDLAKALVDVLELDHFRFAFFSKCRTSRMSGMLMVRYISATSVNTLVFLKVEEAISLPCSASSATVIVEACEESFSSMIMMLP